MKIVLRQVTIIDKSSPHHLKTVDVLIDQGIIQSIGNDIKTDAREIKIPGLHISTGWVDMQCTIGEPGFEQRETLKTAASAALHGGFTTIAMLPSTQPVIDQRVHAESIISSSSKLPVQILPLGAMTMNREGQEMTEMIDLSEVGVTAFSDGKRSVQNPKLLELILVYAQNRDAIIIHHADTPALSVNGIMNEGKSSIHLGLKGIPSVAEVMAVQRDIEILKYTGGRLHFPILTTKDSIDQIRKNKPLLKGVSCGVAPHYLLFSESSLENFDPLYKVSPPYRTTEDIHALIDGLKDGTIDVICSDHTPIEEEQKNNELEHALPGIINLETMFAAARTATYQHIELSDLIEKITTNPRKLLGLNMPVIQEGEQTNLTFFLPDHKWTFSAKDIKSKSKNTPFIGFEFTGKVAGVYTKESLTLFE
jgi:dihydroorotase